MDYRKSKGIPEKNIYFCFIDYTKAFDYIDHNELWKILKEMGIPDYLTCLLRNLYAAQEATVRTGHGKTDWFQIGKGVTSRLYIVTQFIVIHTVKGFGIVQKAEVDVFLELSCFSKI